MKVVVLGGGSTGEHFVGALRRFDDEAQITLVESRLVGGECSYFACMPTKTMLRATELAASLDRDAELTLVERELVGGECSYWACMPTKTMLRSPELVAAARRAPGVHGAQLDAAEV
ncbi:MAG: FAD-dependent oxidoreductase, partial [Gaiellaceae bacterium]